MSHGEGVAWAIRNEEQRQNFIRFIKTEPLPFLGKCGKLQSPKTTQQIRYAHSLCNALAIHEKVPMERAKRDAKAAFGVVRVVTSIVTGDRSANLVSFADYSKVEMEGFIGGMEAYLSERNISFIASEGVA